MNTENKIRVDCTKCKHFKITWNPKTPYACSLLGFRSADVPSTVAFSSTGRTCQGFEPKDKSKAAARKSADTDSDSVIVSIGGEDKWY